MPLRACSVTSKPFRRGASVAGLAAVSLGGSQGGDCVGCSSRDGSEHKGPGVALGSQERKLWERWQARSKFRQISATQSENTRD